MMGESAPIQRWVQLAGYALIVGAALMVLSPFLVPLAWAAILAFATWRPYERVRRGLGGRASLPPPPLSAPPVPPLGVPARLPPPPPPPRGARALAAFPPLAPPPPAVASSAPRAL